MAGVILAQRVVSHVDEHRPGECVGDDERRRRQIVGAYVGVDAALEIAIARKHGGDDEVCVVHRLGDWRRERSRIADAGGAAKSHKVEAQGIEVLLQIGFLQIFFDHLRARRERRFHPRLCAQPARERVARQQSGTHHHARIRGVRARGDRRDHHVSMADLIFGAFHRHPSAPLRTFAEFPIE
jgi:hypothetical protein